jgi:N-acetylmuramoyl-L-alanine amidase
MRASAFLLLVILTSPAGSARADDGLTGARESLQSLRKDTQRRQLRHAWQAVVKRLETVALRSPSPEHAVEAAYLWGEAASELSRYSQRDDDVAEAVRAYRHLLERWPRHRLADDAAVSLAHLLADRRRDARAARQVVEQALPLAQDRKRDLAALLAVLPRTPVKPAAGPRAESRQAAAVPSAKPEARPPSTPARPAREDRPVAVAVPRSESAAPAVPIGAPAPASVDAEAGQARMADALRRAVAPLANLQLRLPADEVAPGHARRTPPARPASDEPAGAPRRSDATLEAPDQGAELQVLQERLRDVRVGQRAAEAVQARASLQQAARVEAAGELTLAQQLGLKVRRVVIDPGHGGQDSGAIGPAGTREKDVALAISLKLAQRLEAMGLDVVLTREGDRFVSLEDRTRQANRERGDLFISVHCNAAASHALRGVETYTLNTSSNRYAIRLAARENATSERGVSDLQFILADLATRANTGESARLAERVQRSVVGTLSQGYDQVRDLGTKEALFFVLLGAKMPSILVETSFISQPDEEKRLADPTYQATVAEAIATGVEAYLAAREQVAQVD